MVCLLGYRSAGRSYGIMARQHDSEWRRNTVAKKKAAKRGAKKKSGAGKVRLRDLSTRKGDLAGGGQYGVGGQLGQFGGIIKKPL